MHFARTLTTDISSDVMHPKVGWGVPLTMYLVCHRQSTEGFTSQLSFQQIKKVILHASWRSRYIGPNIYHGFQFECCCFYRKYVGYPRRTVLIRRYVLTWRRNYLHMISQRDVSLQNSIAGYTLQWETINMVLCLEIRKMSLTIWKDVPSLTIFSNSVFIFLIGQLQIIASALQEMWISSFRTNSQRLSKVLSDQWMSTGIIPNSFSHVQCQ